MTMNSRINTMILRLTRGRDRIADKAVVDDATMTVIVGSIRGLANSLSVPADVLPSMLDLAFDNVPRTDLPSNDALMYAYLLNLFSLYFISDDTYDDIMIHFADEDGVAS